MGYSKATAAMFLVGILCMLITLPPAYAWQQNYCPPTSTPRPHPPPTPRPHPPHHHHHHPSPPHHHHPPKPPSPPHHGGGVLPPITNPPVIRPPPPSTPCPPPGTTSCPLDALKLGLCLDVLGGLVHVIIGNPVENICCPVIQGLAELETAICLCTAIRLKLLNLNIFIPIALQVLVTCGFNPPPTGFVCPPPL